MRRVLLTGGSGFIGRAVADALLRDAWEVTVFDRRPAPGSGKTNGVASDVRLIVGDTTDFAAAQKAIRGQDAIVHLAAGSSFLMYEEHPVPNTSTTIAGFQHVLEAAAQHNVGRVVYASTSAVYEGNSLPYHERMPVSPPDLKAFAKKVNEGMARLYHERYGTSLIALRPFSVYGWGERTKGPYANVISLFSWAMSRSRRPLVWGDGWQTRDFVFVDDVAEAVRLALLAEQSFDVFNVGTGVETSFNQIVATINELLGTDLEPEYVPVPISVYAERLGADTSWAREQLGFESTVDIRTGIGRVLRSIAELPQNERLSLAAAQEQYRHGVAGAAASPPRSASAR
jgi:nucleoside-diphosphate-sugar epimerase